MPADKVKSLLKKSPIKNNKPLTSFVVVALVLPAEVDEEPAEEILEH